MYQQFRANPMQMLQSRFNIPQGINTNDPNAIIQHLMNTGQMQGIPVIDHIIVAENTYYSFYEQIDIKNL